MTDEFSVKVIVTDTGPLITLAAADSLDYLLYTKADLYVPDAVLFEATRDASALGAQQILEWVQANSDRVRTVSTEVFFNYIVGQELQPGRRERDLGERAAIEVIHDGIRLAPNERAVLLTEDDRVLQRVLVTEPDLTETMIPITTRDLLAAMQAAGRINSLEEVYRRAEDAGRLASRRDALIRQHQRALDAVLRVVQRGPKPT